MGPSPPSIGPMPLELVALLWISTSAARGIPAAVSGPDGYSSVLDGCRALIQLSTKGVG